MDIDPQEIIEAIDSESSRRILAAASREPMTADELEQALDVSLTTVYRRTDDLVEVSFLEEETEISPKGDNYDSFKTAIRRVEFTIERGEFRIDVEFRNDTVDRFGQLWRSLGG
ncbi:helix-turn-helix domain-containing protein [Natrinema sp. 1APR25-10V2]|uniref:ArsR/SmtB family transcription factor n=1 Tax=Natrinema sp. 1APR25-10V2 TaxID=2951081 RepID=UPI002873FCC1|nr:helix-turn-helix domain-containing protein [Natrinema sp. 1APR25-10V2]MDS0474888.1 helix-turn-helix domain-containing protein [Natrinema sp. 1APR25-10V2]